MSLFDRLRGAQPQLISAAEALPDSRHPVLPEPGEHAVLGTPLAGPWEQPWAEVFIGMGCYWGAEKVFWTTPGVRCTSVGFAGGFTAHPTYRECCTGRTGHAEVVHVVYNPEEITLAELVRIAFAQHDPTQGMRQGADVGTQYRSAVYTATAAEAEAVREQVAGFQPQFTAAGYGPITTEILSLAETPAGAYYLAEEDHQQYLERNPNGYCPVHATGVPLTPAPGQDA